MATPQIAGWDLNGWVGTLQGASGKGRRTSQIMTTKLFRGAREAAFQEAYLWAARMNQLVSAGGGYDVVTPEGIRVGGVQFIDLRFHVKAYAGGAKAICDWTCIAPSGWPPTFVEHLEDQEILYP